mgnify:CR=1 FL=1
MYTSYLLQDNKEGTTLIWGKRNMYKYMHNHKYSVGLSRNTIILWKIESIYITRSKSSRFSIILINQGADGRDGRPGQPGAPGKDGRDFTSMALLRDAIQENVQKGKSTVLGTKTRDQSYSWQVNNQLVDAYKWMPCSVNRPLESTYLTFFSRSGGWIYCPASQTETEVFLF